VFWLSGWANRQRLCRCLDGRAGCNRLIRRLPKPNADRGAKGEHDHYRDLLRAGCRHRMFASKNIKGMLTLRAPRLCSPLFHDGDVCLGKRTNRKLLMAKPLVYSLGEQSFSFSIASKVDKAALYGYAKRVRLKDERELARGVLLADGRLLPRSAVGYPKADDGGSPIEDPIAHVHGQTVPQRPSSFDAASEMAPMELSDLALFSVRDVYPISAESLPAAGLYRCEFNYRAGYAPNEARILVRADGLAFLLVGLSKLSRPTELALNYAFFDADADTDEDADELDFAMV
jgi:hypothetical protein